MWSWIDTLAGLVAGNPTEALAIVFLAAIIEAVAIVGTLVPGTVILMAVAGAAAIAGQSMLPFLVLAMLGAVIGDGMSYWAGRHFHARLRTIWPFVRHPDLLENAERFFRRYGMASVALCRFVPVLRSNVPLCAGMVDMPPRAFFVANVAGALVWAPAHIYPAQFAGLSLSSLRGGDWSSVALWGGLLLAFIAAAWAVRRWTAARRRANGRS